MVDKSLKVLKGILRKEGLRFTSQRQSVWDEIRGSHEHRDAEDIRGARDQHDAAAASDRAESPPDGRGHRRAGHGTRSGGLQRD